MPIIGEADPFGRPFVRFVLRGESGREQTIEARLDTGFDLSLAIPDAVVASLGLHPTKPVNLRLANGEEMFLMEHRARIMWEGIERPIRVLAKPGVALAGVALFYGYEVTIQFVDGGEVRVDFLP